MRRRRVPFACRAPAARLPCACRYLCNGFYTRCSPDFYNLVGRRPTTYREYLANKGAAGETGLEELAQENLWKKGVDAMKDAA